VTTTAVEDEFVNCVDECDDPQLTAVISSTRVKALTNSECPDLNESYGRLLKSRFRLG
jgi:hypothetical protein